MLKKKMVKRNNIVKLFRKNYGVLSTVFVLFLVIIVLFDSFVVNAESVGMDAQWSNNGTSASDNLVQYYSMNVPPYATYETQDMQEYFDSQMNSNYGSNITINGFGNLGTGMSLYDLYEHDSEYGSYEIVTDITLGNGNSYSGGAGYHLFTIAPMGMYGDMYSISFEGAGDFAVVSNGSTDGKAVVSNQPFYAIGKKAYYFDSWNQYFYVNVSSQWNNGFYVFYPDNNMSVILTDMPIYIRSDNGVTGFTQFSDDAQNDFSFENENFDFNYLINNGDITDPNGTPPESEIEKVSKSYMDFLATDDYCGEALSEMHHNINFNPNEYMRLHGEQFQIVVEHSATYKGSDMQTAVNFTMPEQTIKVDMLLAQSRNGEFNIHLDLHDMVDSNGTDVRQYILNTMHSPSGCQLPIYMNNVNILGDVGQTAVDAIDDLTPLNLSRYTTKQLVVFGNQYNNYIDEFYITSKIYVRSAPPDYTYESGFNLTSYNVKSGEYEIKQNDGSKNLYPPSENPYTDGQPSVIPSGGGSGTDLTVNSGGVSNILKDLANATANAIIESGAIQNTINPTQTAYGGSIESGAVTVQTGGGGFQISNQDWNEYGTLVEEMASDMTDLQSDNGVVSFMGAIKTTYEMLPSKLWTLIFAGVSGSVAIALWTKGSHCH